MIAERNNSNLFWKLLTLVASFFFMLCISGLLSQVLGNFLPAGSRDSLLLSSAIQAVLAFGVTSLFCARFFSPEPAKWLGLETGYDWRQLLGLLAVFLLALPAINQTIFWNESVHFPESMAETEKTLRLWEDTAAQAGKTMMNATSFGGLIINVLVIGVLTGICEELFFRGAFQRLLAERINIHAAVWLAALFFSFMHFQFFGFVPRVLLGALFGYLFAWSGSLWLSATAHALNNSIVVVCEWLVARGLDTSAYDSFGVAESGIPWLAFACAIITVFLLWRGRYLFEPRKKLNAD